MSTELIEKLDAILSKAKIPDRHTYFQMEKFMIGQEPTAQAQLWAIARELEVRKETIETYDKDLADAEDNLELFNVKIERSARIVRGEVTIEGESTNPFYDLNIQEHEINIRKLLREKDALAKAARKVKAKREAKLEEIQFLVHAYDTIVSQVGEMKPFDDPDAQKEMWNEKLLSDLNLRIILGKPIDMAFVKEVLCLHDDAVVKQRVITMIEQLQKSMLERKLQQDRLTATTTKPQVQPKAKITGK